MLKYYRYSALVHAVLLAMIFVSPWIWRYHGPVVFIDGFDWEGGGGGGGGDGGRSGPKATQIGQVVPAPQNVPLPAKPAPVQKATKTEDAWKIDNKKSRVKQPDKPTPPIPLGETAQPEKTNVVSRGVKENTIPGEGSFDYGTDGKGGGKGPGVGIGVGGGSGAGDGSGFGFGSYLGILRRRIWQEWTQSPIYGVNQSCVVGLTVSRSGDVSDIRLEKSSGNSFYDNVAVRSVRNSSPMPPLPSGFPNPEQRFRIAFRLTE